MDENELTPGSVTPDHVLDAKGKFCPEPVLMTKKSIDQVPIDGILELQSTDDGTKRDIPRWTKRSGHEYLGFVKDDKFWRFYIKRTK